MAKELPYFKFEPSEWQNGNIQICSHEAKSCFVDICCVYWNKLGEVSYNFILIKCCERNEDVLNELIENEIIEIKNNSISIKFLDDQIKEFKKISNIKSENAKQRWEEVPERIKGNQVYVIRCWNGDENFIKIGHTSSSINRRYSGKMPYNYEAVIVDLCANDIEIEDLYSQTAISKNCEYNPKIDFAGKFECYDPSCINDLIKLSKIRNAKYVRNNAIREDKIREDKIIIKKTVFNFRKALVDFGFKENLVIEWLKVRKNKKATNSETAFNGFTNQVLKTNLDINYVLKECVERSWSGFKYHWLEKEKNSVKKEKVNAGELIKQKYGLN